MANRNSRARGVPIIGGVKPQRPSPFDQFVGVFLQTLGKKLIPRIQQNPDEGFRTEYGFAGFDQGVLIFNVTWVPREQAEGEGLYERAREHTHNNGGGQPEGTGAGGATEGQGDDQDQEREVL